MQTGWRWMEGAAVVTKALGEDSEARKHAKNSIQEV